MSLTTPLADDAAIFELSYTRGNTGVYHLAGAWGGFFTFKSEWPSGAASIPIRVTDGSANTEISKAAYNAGANTLTVIGSPIASTNGGALVNWSGRTRLLVHALQEDIPLCATPPTVGQILAWDGTEWCPETPPSSIPLCATPPTDGQILVWDAAMSEWCPADFCALVTACLMPAFVPGAVTFDASSLIYNFPAMVDSPVGSMSVWLYIPTSGQPGGHVSTGEIFFDTSLFLISPPDINDLEMSIGQSKFGDTSPLTITTMTAGNPTIITFSNPHGIPMGAYTKAIVSGNGTFWSLFGAGHFSGQWYLVTAVAPTTISVAFNSTGFPAYGAPSATSATINTANAPNFYFSNAASGSAFENSTGTPIPSGQWVNLLASWDTNHASGLKLFQLYYGDTAIADSFSSDAAAFSIGYSNASDYPNGQIWNIGGTQNFGSDTPYTGGIGLLYMAELWFAPGQFLDFTNSANRAKFHNGTNQPVSLGANGSTPTGLAPILYQSMQTPAPDPYVTLGLPLRIVSPDAAGFASRSSNFGNAITSSFTLTFSVWTWGTLDMALFSWGNRGAKITVQGTFVEVDLFNSGGGKLIFFFDYDPTGAANHGLTNIRMSIDCNHAIGAKVIKVYVNATDISGSVSVFRDDTNNLLVDWTAGTGGFVAMQGNGSFGGGYIGELWIAPNQLFDPGAFFYSGGNPTSLGADGSTPSGTAPSVYFNITGAQAASNITTNLGSGGAFVLNGSFRLLPDGATFCKNNTGGKNLILGPDFQTFPLAPIHP